jgi:calmodulin
MSKSYHTFDLGTDTVARFKEAFSLYDKDGSGSITTRELGSVLRVLGQNPTDGELHDAIQEYDRKQTGMFTFQQFLSLMAKKGTYTDSEEDFVAAFSVLDKGGSGFVDARELMHLVTTLGEKLSDDDAEILIRNSGVDSMGRVDVLNFVRMLMAN